MKTVKQLMFLVITSVVLMGCVNKKNVEIKPYTSAYNQESTSKEINVIKINDKRKNKVVALISDEGETLNEFKTTTNLEFWFADALKKDFSTSGIKNTLDAKTSLEINIITLNAKFINKTATNVNLYGNVEIELVFKSGANTKTKTIKSSFKKWKISMRDAADFESFIYESLTDAVLNSVKAIIKTI